MPKCSCQQFELYAAEAGVPTGRGFRGEEDLQQFVDDLRENTWWDELYPNVLKIEARTLKGGKASVGGMVDDGVGKIEMLPCHMYELFVCHEIAHVLAEARFTSHAHDPWFARTYLELVYRVMGSDVYAKLARSFDEGGIDHDIGNMGGTGKGINL